MDRIQVKKLLGLLLALALAAACSRLKTSPYAQRNAGPTPGQSSEPGAALLPAPGSGPAL